MFIRSHIAVLCLLEKSELVTNDPKKARYLVQQDDLRRFEDGSGYGHPLLLSSTQLQTSLPHLRVITCRRSRNENSGTAKADLNEEADSNRRGRSWFCRECLRPWPPPPPPGCWRRCGRSGCSPWWCRWRGPCPGGPRPRAPAETSALPAEDEPQVIQLVFLTLESASSASSRRRNLFSISGASPVIPTYAQIYKIILQKAAMAHK